MYSSLLLVCMLLCCGIGCVHTQIQCSTRPAVPQDRRVDKSSLTIAAYNAEWLFLSRSNCPGTGCPWATPDEAEKHMVAVAAALVQANADIVNLAEVENCDVLTKLSNLLNEKAGMNYVPYLITGTDTATGQNMGLLTRIDPAVNLQRTENRVAYPLPNTKCDSDLSGTTGVSKHLYTYFNVTGLPKPLALFGAHFLAYPDDVDRCVQREAQATVLANYVTSAAINAGHSVVLLGDFNDFDPTVNDTAGSITISNVLNILKTHNLLNVASYIPDQNSRYSCWWDKQSNCQQTPEELSLIDHLLISPDLVPFVEKAWIDHSYSGECGSYDSDHWPVLVRLSLPQQTTTSWTQEDGVTTIVGYAIVGGSIVVAVVVAILNFVGIVIL